MAWMAHGLDVVKARRQLGRGLNTTALWLRWAQVAGWDESPVLVIKLESNDLHDTHTHTYTCECMHVARSRQGQQDTACRSHVVRLYS